MFCVHRTYPIIRLDLLLDFASLGTPGSVIQLPCVCPRFNLWPYEAGATGSSTQQGQGPKERWYSWMHQDVSFMCTSISKLLFYSKAGCTPQVSKKSVLDRCQSCMSINLFMSKSFQILDAQIKHLPKGLSNLHWLKHLDISYNALNYFHDEYMKRLKNLR
jgi:hypothetical protein